MPKTAARYWLMKSEPDCYSIDDLRKKKRDMWDGTRNYQVRNMMRDEMKKGDLAFFYHSNAGEVTGIVGVMEIVKEAYPDPTQFDPQSDHPDPKSDPKNPTWLCVDVRFVEKFAEVVTLKQLKNDPKLSDMAVVQRGNRLSVMPVTGNDFRYIVKLANQK